MFPYVSSRTFDDDIYYCMCKVAHVGASSIPNAKIHNEFSSLSLLGLEPILIWQVQVTGTTIVTRIAHSPTVPRFGSSDPDRGLFPYWNEGGCVPYLRIARSLF